MAVFLLILKIIGGILLSVLALVVIALFIKIRIIADYDEQSSIVIQWLFLKIPVFPFKKKDKKEQKEPASDETDADSAEAVPVQDTSVAATHDAEQQANDTIPVQDESASASAEPPVQQSAEKEKKKPNILSIFYESNGGVDGLILLIRELFSYLGSFFGGLLHAFVIDELMVDMTVTKSDAAQTAIYYGQLCSTIYPMLGAFVTKYRVKQYDFSITPDYIAKKSSAAMHISCYFRPATLIGVVLLLVGRLVFKFGGKIIVRMIKPVLKARKGTNSKENNNNK